MKSALDWDALSDRDRQFYIVKAKRNAEIARVVEEKSSVYLHLERTYQAFKEIRAIGEPGVTLEKVNAYLDIMCIDDVTEREDFYHFMVSLEFEQRRLEREKNPDGDDPSQHRRESGSDGSRSIRPGDQRNPSRERKGIGQRR